MSPNTGEPRSLVGNGRDRGRAEVEDERLDSLVHMQTASVVVRVSDGRLTLSATGGRNTKLAYVLVSSVEQEAVASPEPAPTEHPTQEPTPRPTPRPTAVPLGAAPTGPSEEARVLRIIDGDTILVMVGGSSRRVRYIGIDAPELGGLGGAPEWMARRATEANARLVEGASVVLERDVSDTDRFGRLLRYVWVRGNPWMLVNRVLVRQGYAQASTYPPDVKYASLFLAEQRLARDEVRGLWRPEPTPEPTTPPAPRPTPRPTPLPFAPPPPARDCDPSYPDVSIPSPPPDLDCGDISYRRFTVIGDDPHRFDGDHDGIGCESG